MTSNRDRRRGSLWTLPLCSGPRPLARQMAILPPRRPVPRLLAPQLAILAHRRMGAPLRTLDLVVILGEDHGAGRSGPTASYGNRKRNDFFVRHLLGVEPPPWS
jgi:hypothetical protein